MKTPLIFIALFFATLAAFSQCQPTVTNPAFLVSSDTLDDWQEVGFCFTTACANEPAYSQVIAFRNLDEVLNGSLSFVIQAPGGASFTATSVHCDTVHMSRCIDGMDTVTILNQSGNFNIVIQTEDPQPITLHGFVGGQVSGWNVDPCSVLSASTQPSMPYTYQKFNALTGELQRPSTDVPPGLSLRSDGMKVMRQGAPDSLCLIALAIACAVIVFRSQQRQRVR